MPKSTLRITAIKRLPALAFSLLLSLPFAAGAAGLGKLTVLSVLGQPLRAEVELSASREELPALTARLATPEAFRQAGIEYIPALNGLRLSVDKRANGQPYLRLTTDRSMNEPFLDILVEMSWASGRLVREYTFLLDPPEAAPRGAPAPAPLNLPEAPAVAPREPAPAAIAPPPAPALAPPPAPAPALAPPPAPAPVVEAPAPKPRPQPPRVVEAKAPPAVATRSVKSGDTLGKIAVQTRPEGVSLDQMLVALFRSNPDAFDGNNMNRLRSGRILTLPQAGEISSVDAAEAKKTVLAQSADFNAYRKKLAAVVAGAPAKEAPPQQAASGKITPKVEDKQPAQPSGKDKLEISKSAAAKDAKAAEQGGKRIAALEEDVVARNKALQEAKSRIADLEKNIGDMKKLVELKNQALAQLQQQAKAAAPQPAAKPEAAKPEIVKPEIVKPEIVKPEIVKPMAPPEPAKPAAVPAPEAVKPEPPKPEAVAAAPEPSVKPAEPPKPPVSKAPPPPPPPPPSFFEESPELVYGGAGIAVLLLGYAAYALRRRRQQAEEAGRGPVSRIGDAGLGSNSVIGSTGGQSVDTTNSALQTDFSQSGLAALDSDEGVDPVAEADVYMAYGRDTQAEEILLEALKHEPTRHAIRLKLMEIYTARKSLKQFESVATELYSQTGGVGPDWEKAVPLVQKMDPENPLYGRRAAEVGELPQLQDDGGGENFGLTHEEAPVSPVAEPAAMAPAEEPAAEETPMSLDFDLDLGAPESAAPESAEPASATASPEAAEPPPDEEPAALDFALSMPAPESSPPLSPAPIEEETPPLELPALEPAASVEAEAAPDSAEAGLAFPAAEPAPQSEAAPAEVAVAAETGADTSLDFDFDLGKEAPAAEMAEPAAEIAEPAAAPSFDFSGLDLELNAQPAEAAAAATEAVVEAAAVPAASPEVSEEVATKLELAHAYEEMGDKEGARELLEEVINEGNAEQQEAARVKLAQLG